VPHRHPKRPPIPTLWLMTDERMGDDLWAALRALPYGAGIVFRHYRTQTGERRALFARIARLARHKRLVLVRAGSTPLPGEAGVHGAGRVRAGGIRTWAVHSRAQAIAGKYAGADAVFVSSVYPTRSHPGAATLGPARAAKIARGLDIPIIALGGMDAAGFRKIRRLGFHGWAAIDAWLPDQKRNAVPI
jgi:thiamine-phosphate pyrophosphorylase